MPSHYLTREKAKKILRHGEVRGSHSLTEKQKGFFGLIASGKRPSMKKMASLLRKKQ